MLRLPTKFEMSVDDISVFPWFLLNKTKNFSGVGKIVAQSATISPTPFFYRVTKNIWGRPPPSPIRDDPALSTEEQPRLPC